MKLLTFSSKCFQIDYSYLRIDLYTCKISMQCFIIYLVSCYIHSWYNLSKQYQPHTSLLHAINFVILYKCTDNFLKKCQLQTFTQQQVLQYFCTCAVFIDGYNYFIYITSNFCTYVISYTLYCDKLGCGGLTILSLQNDWHPQCHIMDHLVWHVPTQQTTVQLQLAISISNHMKYSNTYVCMLYMECDYS